MPIPRAVVKASVDRRDTLTNERYFFHTMEIKFSSNEISRQDDYAFPRCSICQAWGHWMQKCPSKKINFAYCMEEYRSSNCPRTSKCCVNCLQGHCAFSKSCDKFKRYVLWVLRNNITNEQPHSRP
ncbi:hypothetical protein ACOME3_002713 [Neoechinorhynchus agilis]